MYRSASRHESRSIMEKPSRSARSTWVEPQQSRSFATDLEDDERGILRDHYVTDDLRGLDRNFQRSKGTIGGTDLREAQRLAASFFSQYSSASTAPDPVYRDAGRSSLAFSLEVPMDRYSTRGQHRDRDLGVERWADRANPETLYPTSRTQLVMEDWEEERVAAGSRRERMDFYGVSAGGARKMSDGAWNDTDHDCSAVRKETDYPSTQDLDGGLRVTKRVDWTELLRSEGSRIEGGLGSTLSKRAISQTYRAGGRPLVDSCRNVLEEELDPDGSLFSRCPGYYGTERYREPDVRKERGYLDKGLPEVDEYVIERSVGSRVGGRGGRGRDDWRTDHEPNGRGRRISYSARGRDKSRLEDRDSRRLVYSRGRNSGGGSGSGADIDIDFPDDILCLGKGRGARFGAVKRDFFQRASITNQDILAVYYGNPGPTSLQRSFPYSGPSRYHSDSAPRRSERHCPRPSGSPTHCRQGRFNPDHDSSRKGKKRWGKPAAEGTEVKRFKRETQSDKLYLMHNRKANTEEKEQEAALSASVVEREAENIVTKEVKGKGEASGFLAEDAEKPTDAAAEENDPTHSRNGFWDNEDSWSDSEDEDKQAQITRDGPHNSEPSAWDQVAGEERELATFQALQSGAVSDSKKFLGECSEDDEDDDADWESLASKLYDRLDNFCVHQGLEAADAVTECCDDEGLVPTNFEARESEENGRFGTLSAQSQDSEMVDVDNYERSEEGKEAPGVPDMDTSVKQGSVGVEKKVVVIMEELQESVKNREDKAFDYYVSLFEQDTDLVKLYEANVNCGSFECLVCAGVGAKKKRFPDVPSLVQHAKKILRTKKLPEHRGFARAVCNILGCEAVPGPSVILPRGSIRPQQSEPSASAGAVGDKQTDWEWAAARQLFEEQEARIEVTTRSSVEALKTASVVTIPPPPSIGGQMPVNVERAKDKVTAVVTREEETQEDVNSVPGKVSGVGLANVSQVIHAVQAILTSEKAEVPGPTSVSEVLMMVESTIVPENTELGGVLSGTDSAALSVGEVTTLAPEVEETSARNSSEMLTEDLGAVEMWAPLPLEIISRDDCNQVIDVEAYLGYKGGPLAVDESGVSAVVPVGYPFESVGILSGVAALKEVCTASLVSPEGASATGVEVVECKSRGDRLDISGDTALLPIIVNGAEASFRSQKQDYSTLGVVSNISLSELDSGLPSDTV